MFSVPEIRGWAVEVTRPGKWAIITGASSGIGRALAFEFASGGFNLLLTARNEAALTEVAAQCRSKSGIETEVIAADLGCADSLEALVQRIAQAPHPDEVLV